MIVLKKTDHVLYMYIFFFKILFKNILEILKIHILFHDLRNWEVKFCSETPLKDDNHMLLLFYGMFLK